jgi:hypothetical protein
VTDCLKEAAIDAAPAIAVGPFAAESELIDTGDPRTGAKATAAGRDERWLDLLFSHPPGQLVANVQTKWLLAKIGGALLPVTINAHDYGNSYVCSPYTACVLYPRSEVEKLDNRLLGTTLRAFLQVLGPPLRAARVNRLVCVNNWLLSTNLYPPFDPAAVRPLTKSLVERFPTHAVAWRSLNGVTNAPLLAELAAAGYLLAPSRQVYFFDGANGDSLRRPNCRWDQKLLDDGRYRVVPHDELGPDDAARIEQLYRMLYVDKYSPYNPQFTPQWFDECRRRQLLELWGLRDPSGRLDGVVGLFERDSVITVPVVGYDTALPQKLGLYRRLMAIAMRTAAERRRRMNLSSGAAEFKRLRGCRPEMEYTAVYCRHLSRPRRAVWHVLAGLLNHVGAPILRKYRL